jgi:3-oxoacyl-[acyl-carrier protein] reductase
MDLKDKKILVTGASSGIGQAVAIACAQAGAIVLAHYRNNFAGAEQTLSEVKKVSTGEIFQADLTDIYQIERMFTETEKQCGKIDLLVNNAGHAQWSDFFDNDSWKGQFENIFFSALHVSQYFLKQNTEAALRKIVSIGSVYGNIGGGNTEFFAYSVAKAALHAMNVALAKIDPKVLVNVVAPGYTWTAPWEGIPPEEKKLCEDRTMIERFIEPAEVAQLVRGILENDAMTGQVVTIDGGLLLQRLERK